MFTSTVSVNAADLVNALAGVKPLFVKGSKTIALHLVSKHSKLTVTAGVDSMYTCDIPVVTEDAPLDVTVTYFDITTLIANSGLAEFELIGGMLEIHTSRAIIKLPPAFSTVQEFPEDYNDVYPVSTDSVVAGVKTLLSAGLSRIYKKEKSITLHTDYAVIKYPNIWVRTRTIGLHWPGVVLAPDTAKMVVSFAPEAVAKLGDNYLVLFHKNDKMLIPVKLDKEPDDMLAIINTLGNSLFVNIATYLNDLRVLSHLETTQITIEVYDSGFVTRAHTEGAELTIPVGSINNFVHSFRVPLDLWIACFSILGGGDIELLYKGDIICLRTRTVCILLRALL